MSSPASSLWYVCNIHESIDELLHKLDKKELYIPHLKKISSENRQKEWLTVRTLLKDILKEEKEICYTESGKPYLSDNSYQISISHTKGFVAIALHPSFNVGIDIEHISPRVRKIRNRFINNIEESNIDKSQEDIHLLLHWSAKETLFKILGEEGVDFKDDLHISGFTPVFNQLSMFSARETKTNKQQLFDIHYLVTSDYVLTFTSISQDKSYPENI